MLKFKDFSKIKNILLIEKKIFKKFKLFILFEVEIFFIKFFNNGLFY